MPCHLAAISPSAMASAPARHSTRPYATTTRTRPAPTIPAALSRSPDSSPAWSPTPRTLGVSGFLGYCGARVPCVFRSPFRVVCGYGVLPACRGGCGARFHGPRPRRAGRFLLPDVPFPGSGLAEAGREDGDLGFPGDGRLGRGGVRELRACFLGAF